MIHSNARMTRTACSLLLGVMGLINSFGSAHAQTTNTVEIDFQGTPCWDADHQPKTVQVVVNGSETSQFTAYWNETSHQWTGERTQKSFPAESSRASLRLGGMRTECEKSVPHKSAAQFLFSCDKRTARKVTFSTNPPDIKIGYVRRHPQASVDCTEWGYFLTGPKPVIDIWPNETVRLHLGWTREDHDALGLLVISPDRPALIRFNQIGPDATANQSPMTLPRNGVVFRLIDQRAKADGSAPTFSSAAVDLDTAHLKSIGLTQIDIMVEK
jgi:hypothetical protein